MNSKCQLQDISEMNIIQVEEKPASENQSAVTVQYLIFTIGTSKIGCINLENGKLVGMIDDTQLEGTIRSYDMLTLEHVEQDEVDLLKLQIPLN